MTDMSLNNDINRDDKSTKLLDDDDDDFMVVEVLCVFDELLGGCVGGEYDADAGADYHDDGSGDVGRCFWRAGGCEERRLCLAVQSQVLSWNQVSDEEYFMEE